MSLLNFFRKSEDNVLLTYSLLGTEKVNYGQIDEVMENLKTIGAAAALYHIKNDSNPDNSWQQALYDLTNGMSEQQVNEMADGVVNLMDMLNNGKEGPYEGKGKIEIVGRKVHLLESQGIDLTFKINDTVKAKDNSECFARLEGEDLYLRWSVGDGAELMSISEWSVRLSTGLLKFSLKEARYWQVKDYGRVLVNQVFEASGTAQRIM